MILALCLSYFTMFSSGVNVTKIVGERFFAPNDYIQTSSTQLLGASESIDYYSNGDYSTTYNTTLDSYYSSYDSTNAPYYTYTYHNAAFYDMTLCEGVKYDISLTADYNNGTPIPSDNRYIGYFAATYDYHSTLDDTSMVFIFNRSNSAVRANLDIIVDIGYFSNNYNFITHRLHMPLYKYNDNVFNYLQFNLDDLNIENATDQIYIDFQLSLVDMDIATIEFYQEGWTDGYDIGYGEGYNTGYDLGQASDESNFKGLLGALIDTPILFLRKFFGYEVFGVNIYAALATMISLIVALSIFRLVRAII